MEDADTLRLDELMAWKTRVETAQAERLMLIYNELIDVFVGKSATISEVMTVLRMAELNAVHGYLNKQLNPDSVAQAALSTVKR